MPFPPSNLPVPPLSCSCPCTFSCMHRSSGEHQGWSSAMALHLSFIPLPTNGRKAIHPYSPRSANEHAATACGSRVSWTRSLINFIMLDGNPGHFYELFSAAETATPHAITARRIFLLNKALKDKQHCY